MIKQKTRTIIMNAEGKITIPKRIRKRLELNEGDKVLFAVEGDLLIIKKLSLEKTWKEITRPLRGAMKNMREEDVPDLIHKIRKEKRGLTKLNKKPL